MSYPETRHFIEEVERHIGDLDYVPAAVRLWQTADYHVGVADGLHLRAMPYIFYARHDFIGKSECSFQHVTNSLTF